MINNGKIIGTDVENVPFSFCEYELLDTVEQDCHSALEITLFKCSGVYTINGKGYEFDKGSIFLIPSNAKHSITKVKKKGVFYNIRFETRFIWGCLNSFDRKYLDVFLCADKNFIPKLDESVPIYDTLVELFDKISEEFDKKQPGFEQMSKALLMMLLTNIYRHYTYDVDLPKTVKTDIVLAVANAVDYIDEHFNEPITLSEIATAANLSVSYFGVVFKRLNGVTPWEYITSKRVEMAVNIIKTQEYSSVIELAEKCGFNNVTNFNRMFKKYTGTAPSRYKTDSLVLKPKSSEDF